MSKKTDASVSDAAMQAHLRHLTVLAARNGMKQTAAARKYQVNEVTTVTMNQEIHLKDIGSPVSWLKASRLTQGTVQETQSGNSDYVCLMSIPEACTIGRFN